jgi:hypothetical protein
MWTKQQIPESPHFFPYKKIFGKKCGPNNKNQKVRIFSHIKNIWEKMRTKQQKPESPHFLYGKVHRNLCYGLADFCRERKIYPFKIKSGQWSKIVITGVSPPKTFRIFENI